MSSQPEGCVSDHISSPDCVNGFITHFQLHINFWSLDGLCNCLVWVPIVEILISYIKISIEMQKL